MKRIHVWNMGDGGQWAVDQRPLVGHTASVEDIQWSPTEDSVRLLLLPVNGMLQLFSTLVVCFVLSGRFNSAVGCPSTVDRSLCMHSSECT